MLDGQEKKKCSRGGAQSLLKRFKYAFGKILGLGVLLSFYCLGLQVVTIYKVSRRSSRRSFKCFYASPLMYYEYYLLVSNYLFLLPYILRLNVLIKL